MRPFVLSARKLVVAVLNLQDNKMARRAKFRKYIKAFGPFISPRHSDNTVAKALRLVNGQIFVPSSAEPVLNGRICSLCCHHIYRSPLVTSSFSVLAWRFVASPITCILTVYLSHQLQSAVYTHLSGRRSYNYCLILSSGTQNDRARLFLCTSVSLLCFSSCTQFYLFTSDWCWCRWSTHFSRRESNNIWSFILP